MRATLPLLESTDFPAIRRLPLQTLQVNLTYRCNQTCVHCHVNAGPKRTEEMALETIEQVVDYLKVSQVTCLDLTGGAPELNPHFRYLVRRARALGMSVIDRCNLTILEQPGQQDLAEFLAAQGVVVTASLPCYLGDNVDRQRGDGVFESSIRGLQCLNRLGYGVPDSGLVLDLVYNPQGPELPPPQERLESDYREHLYQHYGIHFSRLYTLTNMPIQRFGSTLLTKGRFHTYMALLRGAYQAQNLDTVMCRSLLSVDWQGYVYDCDFNQMLDLPLHIDERPRLHLSELIGKDLSGNPVLVADHCYGCTAGQGSSCGGALQSRT